MLQFSHNSKVAELEEATTAAGLDQAHKWQLVSASLEVADTKLSEAEIALDELLEALAEVERRFKQVRAGGKAIQELISGIQKEE